MADYAYKDSARKQRIYADDIHIMNYKGIRCWCKNTKCDAHMYIVKPENPHESFFRASKKVKHSGACGSECNHFNKNEFDESGFYFPDVLRNLEYSTSTTMRTSIANTKLSSNILSENKKTVTTIRQIYTMCTNTPIDDSYGGIVIKDILADERSFYFYTNGIEGYKLVECNYYRYDRTALTIWMNYPCYFVYPATRYYVQLEFADQELYNKMLPRIYDTKHNGIIIVSGNWKITNISKFAKPIKSKCKIYSEKQIAVIKKE